MEKEKLIGEIKEAAFEVRKRLSPGFLEKVYKNALMVELRLRGLDVIAEQALSVQYKGYTVGEFYADLMVEGCIIIELKAVADLSTVHQAQLVNYLVATGCDDGILINFGSNYRFMRKTRIYDESVRKNFS